MSFRIRQLTLAALMACLLVSGVGENKKSAVQTGENAAARNYPEVRLRKLHLVRPDLIPYPIAYDVYC